MPQNISIRIPDIDASSPLLLLIPVVIIILFVYWNETRRDGFDEEKSLDLFLSALFSSLIFSRFLFASTNAYGIKAAFYHTVRFWTEGFDEFGAIIGLVITIYFFAKSWKWSLYRITDIFSIVISLGISLMTFGLAVTGGDPTNLLVSAWYFALYFLLSRVRLNYRSGLVFSIFLLGNIFVGLMFYVPLIIISVVNLYFRERKNPMRTKLPAGFLNKVKGILRRKEKELDAEQKKLLDEDPYMVKGRDSDNEYLDDVTEDIAKRESDLRVSSIKDLRIRVKKALARIRIGSYGVCEVCGKPIDIERLKAYPAATTCVKHSS